MISMGGPDRALCPSPCENHSNQRWYFGLSLTAIPSHCNEAPHDWPSAVPYPSLALNARELLVPVFGGIAQPAFAHTHDASPPFIGVGQLMRKDCLQLAN